MTSSYIDPRAANGAFFEYVQNGCTEVISRFRHSLNINNRFVIYNWNNSYRPKLFQYLKLEKKNNIYYE